jgi:hypothetical protein
MEAAYTTSSGQCYVTRVDGPSAEPVVAFPFPPPRRERARTPTRLRADLVRMTQPARASLAAIRLTYLSARWAVRLCAPWHNGRLATRAACRPCVLLPHAHAAAAPHRTRRRAARSRQKDGRERPRRRGDHALSRFRHSSQTSARDATSPVIRPGMATAGRRCHVGRRKRFRAPSRLAHVVT